MKEVWQWAAVADVRSVTDDIREITLAAGLPAPAGPGDHVDIAIEREQRSDLRRSYSIVRSSDSGDTVTLAVRKRPGSLGGSLYMHKLGVGDRVRMTQPLQNFPLRIGAAHYLLVAGGVGITAIAAMADRLRRIGADYQLVYLSRTEDTAAYLEELRDAHGERLHSYLGTDGRRLDVDVLVKSLAHGTELYTCGPIRLMDALRRAWVRGELDESMFRYETFGNSGWYEPEPFLIEVPRLGVTATISADKSILETLEDAGIDVMFDCRRGECGLCEMRILGSTGEIEHRDVFYSDRQKKHGTKLCACVSRVVSSTADSRQDMLAGLPKLTVDFG